MEPALDRPVAIKVIAARTGVVPLSGAELDARFVREARVAARISHPGVVTVHDAGREGDSLYLVMELVEGEALGERLARRDFPAAAEALEVVAQVADALAAAHALGVVHRDIKPGNVILTRGGRVKVADFGVAKAIGEDTDLTRNGTVVGSPAYMAPAAPTHSLPVVAPTAVRPAAEQPTAPPIVAIFYCRRGAEFKVSPEEAVVTVDGNVLGKAGGREHVFDRPGKHLVRLSMSGYRTTWVQIVVDPAARDDIVEVDTVLPQQ